MRRSRRLAVMVLGLFTFGAVLAAPAGAALIFDLNRAGSVVITDPDARVQKLGVRLVLQGSTTLWEFDCRREEAPCAPVLDIDARTGCQGGLVPLLDAHIVRCARVAGAPVIASLAGGDDTVTVAADSQPFTEVLNVSLGEGNDTYRNGGPGADVVAGGSGDDSLEGGAGDDTLDGGPGNDTLRGDAGSDTLRGIDGNDALDPGVGADSADGGFGDDVIFLNTLDRDETDQVQGGVGFDTASYTFTFVKGLTLGRRTPVRIIEADLESLAGEKDTDELDVLRSIESYGGGSGNDIITGVLSSNAGIYDGRLGSDQLFGTSGNNVLIGGDGADTLKGNAGNDVLNGKLGESPTAAVADTLIDCGDGTDAAIIDLKDAVPKGCESVDRSPIREGPHVVPRIPDLLRVADGGVGVRLACPAALRPASLCGHAGAAAGRADHRGHRVLDPPRALAAGGGGPGRAGAVRGPAYRGPAGVAGGRPVRAQDHHPAGGAVRLSRSGAPRASGRRLAARATARRARPARRRGPTSSRSWLGRAGSRWWARCRASDGGCARAGAAEADRGCAVRGGRSRRCRRRASPAGASARAARRAAAVPRPGSPRPRSSCCRR